MAKDMPRYTIAASWFVRACSLVVLVIWGLTIKHSGLSKDFRSFGSATGVLGAVMWVTLFSAAGLVFPHQ